MSRTRSNEHRVIVEFNDGVYLKKLIHPENGCRAAQMCSQCGRDFADEETVPCYDCKPPVPAEWRECWVQGWFDNVSAEEMLHGRIELTVEPRFDYDSCELHILNARAANPDA